jgi:helicase
MEKLIDINKLYLCLKDIIDNREEVAKVREIYNKEILPLISD